MDTMLTGKRPRRRKRLPHVNLMVMMMGAAVRRVIGGKNPELQVRALIARSPPSLIVQHILLLAALPFNDMIREEHQNEGGSVES